MVEEVKLGDMIDMVGARFEMVARMGITPGDTVLFRTRMAPGKLVPLHSHIDPECFYVLEGRLEVFLMDDVPKWNVVHSWPEFARHRRDDGRMARTCGPRL